MKSKERIRPVNPKDVSNLIREAKSTTQFEPGTLVRRTPGTDSDLIEEIDCSNLGGDFSDVSAAAEMVWTDMTTRFDALQRPEYDHTASPGSRLGDYYKATTLPHDFLADVEIANVFDGNSQSPSGGDVVIKSTSEAGKLEAVSDVSGFIGGNGDVDAVDFPGLKVGVVQADSDESGFVRVQFTLA